MLLKLISWLEKFEDPKHPLLGPNIKILYLFGIWQPDHTKLRNKLYNIFHYSTAVYIITQCVDLYMHKNDINKVLDNLSLTSIAIISCTKCMVYVYGQSKWQKLVACISAIELAQLKKNEEMVVRKLQEYKLYARIISYLFIVLVLLTILTLIGAPLLKLAISETYRKNIENGLDEYPQLMGCWFPFDDKKMPGYIFAFLIQIIMSLQGSGVLSGYDAAAISIMTFMKGQMQILKMKCVKIFDTEDDEGPDNFLDRMKECHRHHNFLLEQSKLFNILLSPVMSVYIFICSIALCSSIIQFSSNEATAAQKLWAVEYTLAQITQLFLFCWHANEVFVESKDVDQSLFASDWWKADVRTRKVVILLAGKLNRPILYTAGPFSNLNVPTFISIMKGSYSFFTLFSQMQEDN